MFKLLTGSVFLISLLFSAASEAQTRSTLPCGVAMSYARTISFKLAGKTRQFVESETVACDEHGRPFYALEFSTGEQTRFHAAGYSLRLNSLDTDLANDPRIERLKIGLSKKDRQYFVKTIVPLLDAGEMVQARQLWIERLLSR